MRPFESTTALGGAHLHVLIFVAIVLEADSVFIKVIGMPRLRRDGQWTCFVVGHSGLMVINAWIGGMRVIGSRVIIPRAGCIDLEDQCWVMLDAPVCLFSSLLQ